MSCFFRFLRLRAFRINIIRSETRISIVFYCRQAISVLESFIFRTGFWPLAASIAQQAIGFGIWRQNLTKKKRSWKPMSGRMLKISTCKTVSRSFACFSGDVGFLITIMALFFFSMAAFFFMSIFAFLLSNS